MHDIPKTKCILYLKNILTDVNKVGGLLVYYLLHKAFEWPIPCKSDSLNYIGAQSGIF